MVFKVLALWVACILIIQPAQCGIISKLSNIKTAAVGTVSDIASIVPNMIMEKGSAVVQAAAKTGNIIAVSGALKAQALEKATSSITDAVSCGLISIGRFLSRQGTGLVERELDSSPNANLGQLPEDNMIDDMSRIGRRRLVGRPPYGYRIVYTPREYRGPHGTIRIE